MQEVQVSNREGHGEDRQIGRESVHGRQDESVASPDLPVRGVRQTESHHQEDRRSCGGRERVGRSEQEGQGDRASYDRRVRKEFEE